MRIYYGHLLAVTGASDWARRSSDRLTLLSNIDNDIHRARGNSEFWFVEDLFILSYFASAWSQGPISKSLKWSNTGINQTQALTCLDIKFK